MSASLLDRSEASPALRRTVVSVDVQLTYRGDLGACDVRLPYGSDPGRGSGRGGGAAASIPYRTVVGFSAEAKRADAPDSAHLPTTLDR